MNVERPDGCTVLDKIWEAEPFASHDGVRRARDVGARRLLAVGSPRRTRSCSAATQSLVGTASDHQVDNSCTNRVAFTFDDGPSYYRPRTLQYFRDKQVHGDFFDLGMRAEANPEIERFAVAEGHVLLSHTYNHTDMNALSDAAKIEEITHNEAVFNAIGAPFTFKGIRTPFGSANTHTQEVVAAQGYTYFLTRIETGNDYEPATTAQQTADGIISRFRPGAIIGIHDGPIDTPAGLATSDAVPMIIDRGRALGYCFGKVDRSGQVVADRYVSLGQADPAGRRTRCRTTSSSGPGTPPAEWFVAPDGLGDRRHALAGRCSCAAATGTITIIVSNLPDEPSDADPVGGSTVTVTDAVPTGLTVVSASGPGWTCSGTRTRTCTRTDTLAPHASYPPITIAVTAPTNAPGVVSNAPKYIAHGQSWANIDTDPISVGVPADRRRRRLGAGDAGADDGRGGDVRRRSRRASAKDYTATTTATVISTRG